MAYGEASNAVLNNEAGAVQGEISDILRDEIIDFLEDNDLKATSEEFGISEADLIDDYEINDMIEYYKEQRGDAPTEGVDQSLNEDFVPDYTATAKYEGPGRDVVTIDTSGNIDPMLIGMAGGGKGGMFKEGAKKLANKVLASKSLKANQKANRGVEGPVVKGASRTLKDSNLRPSIANKTADRYKSMSDKVTKDRAVKAGTTAGAATAIGLMGNRNKDGDFEKVDLGRPEIYSEETGFDNEANNRAMIKQMNDPDGFLQRQMRKKSTSGKTEQFGQEDGRIVKTEAEEPETMGNQYGYHKREGQNFWTVNNDDPYWDTHEMGTGDAWSDAELKKAPAKELDWSSWFN